VRVRTRYAPSPTGEPHLGNIRTALYAWLLARRYGGDFLLRIEDTDQQRYVEGGVEAQMSALRWLGLEWDEGPDKGGPHAPYIQSQRLPLYQGHAQILIDGYHAYRCYCTSERLDEVRREQQARKEPPRYDRACRDLSDEERAERESTGIPWVIRFKTPLDGETVTRDLLRGEVTFQNDTLDDFVLLKSDGFPTYHLASIVDDHLMDITHVIRGEEWLPSAPRHFLMYQAFEWDPPEFAHVSRILGADRAKLSKRHGAHSVLEYREQGYLPDALVNFLALLGWSLDDHTDIISRETLAQNFDPARLIPNPAVFNAEKLLWMNGVYIRDMPPEQLASEVMPYLDDVLPGKPDPLTLAKVIPLVRDRIKLLPEIVEMADFFFIDESLGYEPTLLLGKKFADDPAAASEALRIATEAAGGAVGWSHEALEAAIRPVAEKLSIKAGDLFGVIRVAITGRTAAPPLFETMEILGRDRSLARMDDALKRLQTLSAG
jgi:glutamyl-tRNA synthetase